MSESTQGLLMQGTASIHKVIQRMVKGLSPLFKRVTSMHLNHRF